MEAIELHHAEHRTCASVRSSLNDLRASGRPIVHPRRLSALRAQTYFSDAYVLDWIEGEELVSKTPAWLPSSAAYWCVPFIFKWSTNGLASGNHLVEATLHALYELIERDTVASLSLKGRTTFFAKRCRFINLESVPDGPVKQLHDRLSVKKIKLVLIWIENQVAVPTFMAILLDRQPFGHCSTVNVGYGAHLSATVAAVRAITEAAQSRLTFIHGAREDMKREAYQERHDKVFRFFDAIEANDSWRRLGDRVSDDLLDDYHQAVSRLVEAGYKKIFRVNMTRPEFDIPVVKLLIPGMRMNAAVL